MVGITSYMGELFNRCIQVGLRVKHAEQLTNYMAPSIYPDHFPEKPQHPLPLTHTLTNSTRAPSRKLTSEKPKSLSFSYAIMHCFFWWQTSARHL